MTALSYYVDLEFGSSEVCYRPLSVLNRLDDVTFLDSKAKQKKCTAMPRGCYLSHFV